MLLGDYTFPFTITTNDSPSDVYRLSHINSSLRQERNKSLHFVGSVSHKAIVKREIDSEVKSQLRASVKSAESSKKT